MTSLKAKSSKNIFIAAGLLAFLCAAIASYLLLRDDNNLTGEPVAQINGEFVYSSDVEKHMNLMLNDSNKAVFDKLDKQSKLFVVTELAAQRLILEKAYKEGFKQDAIVNQKVNAFKDEVIKEEFLTRRAKDIITDEKIKERYDQDVAALKGKTQYKASHIVVKTQNEANQIKLALNSKSFAQLAKERSIDGRTASKGGDLGYLISGVMLADIEKVIVNMSEGSVSHPIQTKFGWHIVKLDEKKLAAPAPYDAVKDRLAQALYQEEIKNYVDSLIASTKIELLDTAKEATEANAENTPTKESEVKDLEAKDLEAK
jgi:peptidyl-prolyl cis-trans isomerase C